VTVPYLETPLPRVFAHRGLALDVPENTLLAFVKALALGAHYLETDVHATLDGVAVISHDADLVRLAGLRKKVGELTLAQLKEIDLGEGQTFSSLAEALEAFPDARFNIDIKSTAAVRPTIAAILEARAVHRVLIGSFGGRRLRDTLKGLPGAARGASPARVLLVVIAAKLGITPLLRGAVRHIDALQVPERFGGIRIATRGIVRRLHDVGIEMHVWTVNDERIMRRLLDIGVDGFITDRSDLALRILEERSSRSA
jgi:glycerophosphoryl diester phosphodiesterase